jgi:hypothetical protein
MFTPRLRRSALLVEAFACALIVRVTLRLGTLPMAVRAARLAGSCFPSLGSAAECMTAADLAATRLAHPTCLYRALTAYAMLAHRSDQARFHLGATRAQALAVHAWVSLGGHPLDLETHRYVPLWTAPAPAPGR